MTENMKRWLELLSEDEGLRNDLMPFGAGPRDEAVKAAIGKAAERGIVLTEDDFAVSGDELSDDELDAVAGGGGCGCPGIGGGTGESTNRGKPYECGCVGYGMGWDKTPGRTQQSHCGCLAIGGGTDAPPPQV